MPSLQTLPTTARALLEFSERTAPDWRRDHLGASRMGQPCDRDLWLGFRWAAAPDYQPVVERLPGDPVPAGRMRNLFDRGQAEEARIVQHLRAIGCDVRTIDPATGQQFGFREPGCHVAGSCDGVVVSGLVESSKPHLLEVKTSNAKQFAKLLAEGVEKSKPVHWVQMHVLMLRLNLECALYVCVCKDDDRIHTERLHLDRKLAEAALARANAIVSLSAPPPRIAQSQDAYPCRWCGHKAVCHQGKAIERNCRTCQHARVVADGWVCSLVGMTLTPDMQRRGCDRREAVGT